MSTALYRSVLYIPGSKARALDKARSLDIDAVIFDLEDAVTPDEKIEARGTLARELGEGGYGHRQRIVRINGLDTEWGRDDARTFAGAPCDALLLPKVESTAQLDALTAISPDLPIWCMMETPRAIWNALEIAERPEVEGFVLGTNDLAKELGCATGGDRAPMMAAIQMYLAAARAARIACVDGVYNAFKDMDGLRAECQQGRALGMDGKTLIHPGQVDVANAIFGPTEAEIALSERQIAAFDEATARGEGVAVIDGRIVENLHVETARAVLAKAKVIAERGAQ